MRFSQRLTIAVNRRPKLARAIWALDSNLTSSYFLREHFKKHFPLTREKFKDDEAWWLIRATFDQRLPEHMRAPTVGELKRVLAEEPEIRREILDRASQCAVVAHVRGTYGPGGMETLLRQQAVMGRLADSERFRLPGEHESKPWRDRADVDLMEIYAAVRWFYSLALEAEAQVRAQRFDAVLPPPAPATPSTRGRF